MRNYKNFNGDGGLEKERVFLLELLSLSVNASNLPPANSY